jgi:hypothetical protein
MGFQIANVKPSFHHQPNQWNFEKILNKDWKKERIIHDA